MRALSAAEVLSVCERGLRESPVERPITMLAAVASGASRTSLASLTIGERDARLIDLRERTFGTEIACVVTCPECKQQLDLDFETRQIRSRFVADPAAAPWLDYGAYRVRFRLPNSTDLATLVHLRSVEEARSVLLQHCLLEVLANGEPITADRLSQEAMEAVLAEMEQLDAQAEVRLATCCPGCGHQGETLFDIAAFFWTELQMNARRLLREVHALATAYGWSESDILSMSAARRNAYLELVRE